MEQLIQQVFDLVTGDSSCVEHMKGTEAGMWKVEEMQDNIHPLIINFGDNSSPIDNRLQARFATHWASWLFTNFLRLR